MRTATFLIGIVGFYIPKGESLFVGNPLRTRSYQRPPVRAREFLPNVLIPACRDVWFSRTAASSVAIPLSPRLYCFFISFFLSFSSPTLDRSHFRLFLALSLSLASSITCRVRHVASSQLAPGFHGYRADPQAGASSQE